MLLGQSNMEGHGLVVQQNKGHTTNGTLEYAVKTYKRPSHWPLCDLATAAMNRQGCDADGADFSDLVNEAGAWIPNDNVWIDYLVW